MCMHLAKHYSTNRSIFKNKHAHIHDTVLEMYSKNKLSRLSKVLWLKKFPFELNKFLPLSYEKLL